MGLDAVVYKNARNLPAEIASLRLPTDPLTGEVYSDSGEVKIEMSKLVALQKRLGNIDYIGNLRKTLSERISAPLVLGLVLRDGSHSGDVIAVSQLRELGDELNLIGAMPELSHEEDVCVFVESLTELLQAAQREQNPIVFV